MAITTKHTILYAEDDLDDLFLVTQAFERYNKSIEVEHARNGEEILHYLAQHQKGPLPCLIILDINMPGMNGQETLTHIKQNQKFKHIPVVMFSTSSSQKDKEFAKKWGAEFITKPLLYAEVKEIAKTFVSHCNVEVLRRAEA